MYKKIFTLLILFLATNIYNDASLAHEGFEGDDSGGSDAPDYGDIVSLEPDEDDHESVKKKKKKKK